MLLAAQNADGSPMPDRQIRDNLMSMILAGHETTTGELAWAFQLLAHNPQVQDRLIEEIDGGDEEEYLTATVHETLRHKPVVPVHDPARGRRAGRDRRLDLPPAGASRGLHLPHAPQPRAVPRPARVPPRALHRRSAPAAHVAAVGGRPQALPRPALRAAGGAEILREVLAHQAGAARERRIERPRWRSAILVPHAGSRVVLRRRRLSKAPRVPRPAQAAA